MDAEAAVSQRPSRGPRAVLAAVLLLAPVAIVIVLTFGGDPVNRCLGGSVCGLLEPTSIPVIGSTNGLIAVMAALGTAWLAAAVLTVWLLWAVDPSRVVGLAVRILILVIAIGVLVAGIRMVEGQGQKVALEDAALLSLGATLLLVPMLLALAVLTSGSSQEPASRQTVTPSAS
jgi:hypothetical protein